MKEEVIKSAVEKIRKLWNENPDFQKALRDAIDISADGNGSTSANLSKVEHYLGLDYAIDSQESLINYSFVKDDRIRNTLEADIREMMRFRYGTRGHKVDFDSYCCYAHLQAEMLLNYFYYTVNDGDVESAKSQIRTYEEFTDEDYGKYISKKNRISEIPFFNKWVAFKKQFGILGIDHIDNARKVRNMQFHRSNEKEKEEDIRKYRKNLESKGFPLNEKGYINSIMITNECIKREAEREIRSKSYTNYCFKIWRYGLPFLEIHKTLEQTATKVKEGIEKHKKG